MKFDRLMMLTAGAALAIVVAYSAVALFQVTRPNALVSAMPGHSMGLAPGTG